MAGESKSVLQRCCCRREEDAETELEGVEETEVGARSFAYEVLGARDVILRRSLDPWVSGNVATFDEVGMVKSKYNFGGEQGFRLVTAGSDQVLESAPGQVDVEVESSVTQYNRSKSF